ncbi:MAG: YkgJ family cysteine cluster protein [Flavobacteriales bacterium]|nr:YkgJ family cysteine cluster protein [Flavobacteriales bacterium]
MKQELKQKLDQAKANRKEINKFIKRLKQRTPKNLDHQFQELHDKAFEKIDCLDCANCCKTTSPIFYDKDVERMASHFRIKAADFFDRYLRIDEDGDQVLKSSPCPFLMEDNKCMAYESRPKACREFPHTNRKRMHQILDLTATNTRVCPAVSEIVDAMRN